MMSKKTIIILFILLFCLSCTGDKQNTPVFSTEELKHRTFNFFWDVVDSSYMTLDRYPSLTFSSIAGTGFGLSAYIVGIENHYISRVEGADRVLKTLKVLWELPQGPEVKDVAGYKGFFYHFLTLDSALRFKNVELSSVDTGLLMMGVLSCMTYFDGDDEVEAQIRDYADKLYQRVDWSWMMHENGIMSMGWHPESGFIESGWSGYNEAMFLLIMSLGSPTHPIPDSSWQKWTESYVYDEFYGFKNVQFDPLFGHQYSHIWIDFRNIQDEYMRKIGDDYFQNSVKATLSNRAYCIANPMNWKGYGEHQWGLSACDGPASQLVEIDGKERQFMDYRARGAASIQVVDDGTITPTAAGGSIAFTPVESYACLKNLWESYYDNLVGEYGFKDAFNLSYKDQNYPNGWFDSDYISIDQGAILLQLENHDTELFWKLMKNNKYIKAGLKKAGFRGVWFS